MILSGNHLSLLSGALLLGLALPAASCKNTSSAAELPPPTGSGVSAPAIPAVSELTGDGRDAGGSDEKQFSGTGTLYPRAEAQLGPKATGVLKSIRVEEGDSVKKNQVLFSLDSAQAGLGVQQAKALLEAAEVGMRSAELDYKRTKELYDRGSVAPATFDQVQARYDNAKSAVSQAKVAVSMAQKASGDTVVRSPIDGVVTAKLKNVGETVTMMPPTVVLVVQDVKLLELRARLPERSLVKLSPGTMLRVRFPALRIERLTPVVRINPAVDMMTRTVGIVANLDNADGKLKPGMLAEIDLGDAAAGTADAGSDAAEKRP